MDEFVRAVGDLLVECCDSARWMDIEGDNCGRDLRTRAAAVANALPAVTGRPKADQAALLLLAAGGKLAGERSQGTIRCWLDAERQALQLLGVAPLTKAE